MLYTLDADSRAKPAAQYASMVLAKVGGWGQEVMAARSEWKAAIVSVIAGRKWDILTVEKGGKPPWGPVQGARRGFEDADDAMRRRKADAGTDNWCRSRDRII